MFPLLILISPIDDRGSFYESYADAKFSSDDFGRGWLHQKEIVKPKGVEVSGKILLASGSPLGGGTLVLRPQEGLFGATAQIQQDGTFSLADSSGSKSIVPGKYYVYVLFNDASQNSLRSAVNKRYQSSEDGDSDVIVEIQDATANLVIKLNP